MVDEIDDPADKGTRAAARVVMMGAGVVAERLVRERQRQAQERAHASDKEARQLQERWNGQRALARVEIETADERWLGAASPQQAAAVWQSAHAWASVEPEQFGSSAERLRRHLEDRYGVQIQTGQDVEAQLRSAADKERNQARAHEQDQAIDNFTAATLLTGGDVEDLDQVRGESDEAGDLAERHHDRADVLDGRADAAGYDTDQRRAQLATRIEAAGNDAPVVQERVRAANANAKPSKEATRTTSARRRGKRTRQWPAVSRDTQLGR